MEGMTFEWSAFPDCIIWLMHFELHGRIMINCNPILIIGGPQYQPRQNPLGACNGASHMQLGMGMQF